MMSDPDRERNFEGIGPFHVHPGHAFEGFEIAEGLLLTRCSCGQVLDGAVSEFGPCPSCEGAGEQEGESCLRCDGTGEVVQHEGLVWQQLPDSERG